MVIVVCNQKGGVAKSTTASALAVGLNQKGYKTLLIDLDPQGNISFSCNAVTNQSTSYDILLGSSSAKDAIQQTAQCDIIPANILLSGADKELVDVTGREHKLKEALEPVRHEYSYIIIDTPPSLNTLTINALTAADGVIIPVGADIYSIQGVGQLHETIQTVRKYCNPALKIKGILLTRYNKRTVLSKDLTEVIGDISKQLNTIVYDTVIRDSVIIKESQAQRASLFTYAPKAAATKDYLNFIDEFIKRECENKDE